MPRAKQGLKRHEGDGKMFGSPNVFARRQASGAWLQRATMPNRCRFTTSIVLWFWPSSLGIAFVTPMSSPSSP